MVEYEQIVYLVDFVTPTVFESIEHLEEFMDRYEWEWFFKMDSGMGVIERSIDDHVKHIVSKAPMIGYRKETETEVIGDLLATTNLSKIDCIESHD